VTIEERLAKVEEELVAMKKEFHTARIVVHREGSAIRAVLDGHGLTFADHPGMVHAEYSGDELVLHDREGKKRVCLEVDHTGPGLQLFDSNGNSRISLVLQLQDAASILEMRDKDGKARARMFVVAESSAITLSGRETNASATLAVGKERPEVSLRDRNNDFVRP
jgi:hypothetical protein